MLRGNSHRQNRFNETECLVPIPGVAWTVEIVKLIAVFCQGREGLPFQFAGNSRDTEKPEKRYVLVNNTGNRHGQFRFKPALQRNLLLGAMVN